MHDENSDGIYEATFIFNPSPANSEVENEWVLSNDISAYPKYSSDQLLVDALYKMSLDETMMLKEDDGTFRTGAKWEGVWTRDISYSVLLAYAFLDLEFSKTSLMKKVKNDRIIQEPDRVELGLFLLIGLFGVLRLGKFIWFPGMNLGWNMCIPSFETALKMI